MKWRTPNDNWKWNGNTGQHLVCSPTDDKREENRFTGQDFPFTHSGFQQGNIGMTGESTTIGLGVPSY